MGCECLQIFVGSPRSWAPTVFPEADLERFRSLRAELDLDPVTIHASYLINLASANSEFRHRSLDKLLETVRHGSELGASDIIFHIGSHQGDGVEAGFERILSSLSLILETTSETRITLEPSAGGGHHIGWQLIELASLLDALGDSKRIGVCLDTAHLFATGVDLRDPKIFDDLLAEFDALIGLKRLTVLHLNDSKAALGSKRDRHDNIGEGQLGLETFRHILNHPRLQALPAIMETPGFAEPGSNARNIELMNSLRS